VQAINKFTFKFFLDYSMSHPRPEQFSNSQSAKKIVTVEIPKYQHPPNIRDDNSDDDGYDSDSDSDSDYEFKARAEFRPSKSASKTNNNNDNEQEEPALAGSSNRKGKQAMKATL
jgi:hypothetical protein